MEPIVEKSKSLSEIIGDIGTYVASVEDGNKRLNNIKILPAFALGKRLPRGNMMVMCGAGKALELRQEFAKLLACVKGCAGQ